MNKIKVLYDVVKTMKKKEVINGIANLEVVNADTKLVSMTNEFSRNKISGDIKAKISEEININGNTVKHESTTELNIKDCPHHKFHHGMHMHHNHEMHMHHGHKFSKVLFMLNLLNNLKAEAVEDKTILSLDLKEVLKEVKESRAEFLKDESLSEENKASAHHKHPEFMKEVFEAEYENAELKITVNKNNEVEKAEICAKGDKTINGYVNFIW